ncbi:MAG: hypothetical protein IIX93_13710, partial [Clostridia bacterium]|nr:hypothetical protein [Clostridia bacterium]
SAFSSPKCTKTERINLYFINPAYERPNRRLKMRAGRDIIEAIEKAHPCFVMRRKRGLPY